MHACQVPQALKIQTIHAQAQGQAIGLKIGTSFFSCVTNLRPLFYAWILSSQILSNMHLRQKLFSIFLTQEIEFAIEKAQLACPSLDIKADKDVTLVEVLATIQVPIIQVQTMDNSSRISKRTDIYNLSIPGGYPTNGNDLSAHCLAIMNEFIEDLAQSIRNKPPKQCLHTIANFVSNQNDCYQVQDDFLDCFGKPEVTGKLGTDMQDNKCSWLPAVCMQRADDSNN
uniref:Uncharacterized protein n=1 Tax=Glossina pallidipes TaxID=7398 RepID=A0A1B0A7N4_GLOPL